VTFFATFECQAIGKLSHSAGPGIQRIGRHSVAALFLTVYKSVFNYTIPKVKSYWRRLNAEIRFCDLRKFKGELARDFFREVKKTLPLGPPGHHVKWFQFCVEFAEISVFYVFQGCRVQC
jgi:hypothetical protein